MTVLISDVLTDVAHQIGYVTFKTQQTNRFISLINEAQTRWSERHRDFYNESIAYRPATLVADITDTATLDAGGDVYVIDFAAKEAELLNGARIVLNDVIGCVRSAVVKKANMLNPTHGMANGTATLYRRSVVHDSAIKVYRPFKTTGTYITDSGTSGKMRYLSPTNFFKLRRMSLAPAKTYPTFFTYSGGQFIVDREWEWAPTYSVHFKCTRMPARKAATPEPIDLPDGIQHLLAAWLVARWRVRLASKEMKSAEVHDLEKARRELLLYAAI